MYFNSFSPYLYNFLTLILSFFFLIIADVFGKSEILTFIFVVRTFKGTRLWKNHIETNFREIQKILDSCIAHDYKTKVDALFLKREYLTQAQLKDYFMDKKFSV